MTKKQFVYLAPRVQLLSIALFCFSIVAIIIWFIVGIDFSSLPPIWLYMIAIINLLLSIFLPDSDHLADNVYETFLKETE